MSKNIAQLKSFTKYCEEHPTERFWQALRNWSEYGFIYGCSTPIYNFDEHQIKLQDTFYKN